MARQISAVEVNKFTAGLITDASPLTSPDNASLEEDNMVLNIDGSRSRRLGMDFEDGHLIIDTGTTNAGTVDPTITTYRWDNAGGVPETSLLVVQVANELRFFNLNEDSVSDSFFHVETFPVSSTPYKFSYAVVDGVLVVVNGDKTVYKLEYTDTFTIVRTSSRILVRDLFGVEDVISGFEMAIGDAVQNRPGATTSNHTYNLRNQGWGVPRINGNDAGLIPPAFDPIGTFVSASSGLYPANSDNVLEALYPNAEQPDNRTVDRFFSGDLFRNPLGTSRAAMGYFIIDALDRGGSRIAQNDANNIRYPSLTETVSSLPADLTPSGATCVTEFAGRVWYGGFSGQVMDGDIFSPKLSSYVLFSKVVESPSDITLCFQEGDPTSKNNPDIIDTDGGMIRLNKAYDIQRIINLGSSLMIVAANGVWRVVGGDNGFTATQYIVDKISDRGCTSPDSLVEVDGGFMFWGKDALYHVTQDQYGNWVCNNITTGRIQRLYDSIPVEDKNNVKGEYDTYERKVRWVYYNRTNDTTPTKELVLDLQLQAFYLNTIKKLESTDYPRVVTTYTGRPYIITEDSQLVTVSQREIGYVVVTRVAPTLQFTFASYRDSEFRDWKTFDGIGVDAEAYVVTSYLSGTDFQRDKRIPYITVHLRRTEDGYSDDGEMTPQNASSCLLQARWDWSDSNKSGKWGREFQTYRYRRLYLPVDENDDHSNGFSTVVTRNKLRGSGKVVSLKFRTEPYKDLHLYGWSMIFSVAESV